MERVVAIGALFVVFVPIEKLFAPEFRNRLDAVIPFSHLAPDIVRKVAPAGTVTEAVASNRSSWMTTTGLGLPL